jgi:ribA/ribD-fused uncharacterized protein
MSMKLPLDRSTLEAACRQNQLFTFRCFWKHTPRREGTLSDECFSQWWEDPFEVDGVTYKTAEHWMMASKARLFDDQEVLELILAADSPAKVKKLGRQVKDFNESVWKKHRFDIVTRGNLAKFTATESMRTYLLSTGDDILVEASPLDTVWGIGLAASDTRVNHPERWLGDNLLGFALVRARHVLRGELPAP